MAESAQMVLFAVYDEVAQSKQADLANFVPRLHDAAIPSLTTQFDCLYGDDHVTSEPLRAISMAVDAAVARTGRFCVPLTQFEPPRPLRELVIPHQCAMNGKKVSIIAVHLWIGSVGLQRGACVD
jgi:hypothetical protein